MAVVVLSFDQISSLSFRVLCCGWFQNIFVLVTESSLCWCGVRICRHVDIISPFCGCQTMPHHILDVTHFSFIIFPKLSFISFHSDLGVSQQFIPISV